MSKRLLDLLKLPLHVLALGTQAKSFEGNPVIGNRWLNRLGLHVMRLVLAHGAMRIRRVLIGWRLASDTRQQFARDGFLLIENFLPEDEYRAVRAEADALVGHSKGASTQQGDSQTWQLFLGNDLLASNPAIQSAISDPRFRACLGHVAGRMRTPFHWLQVIRNGAVSGESPDPQRTLHADAFQPSMKAWLFLSDADSRNGAFTYVPGSHRLSRKRIAWEYHQSLIGRNQATQYAARGSFRVDRSNLAALGLPPARELNCPANTLIVADTFGFHCRGPASDANAQRMEIWSLCRPNPFNPLPGLPFEFLSQLERRAYPGFEMLRMRIRDANARRRRRPRNHTG